ncbi:hypothetical protein I5Q34_23390 [Streptomyces sp. AV19]|uniref:DUF5988 family protein n=1 Tax=Streptomyces sp. AV19 TaxID=2793068 RepID=UPI0018FE1165|nr:DUF5988 family protein [Streptomyces sp. AV19]MBH1937178.1 hypothetical protein [Streptomyces sp. AV19]MDG4533633.1 DUF5988 family protein [Streptomyces sp. AV19]
MPDHIPNAVLVGGPHSGLEQDERIRYTEDLNSSIKVFRGNRYEHFHPTDETTVQDELELHVFRWAGRTYVAE